MPIKISELPEIDYQEGNPAWAVVTHEGQSQKGDLTKLATDASVDEKIAAVRADIPEAPDLDGLTGLEYVDGQDAAMLEAANNYTDGAVGGIVFPDPPSLETYATMQWVEDKSYTTQSWVTAQDYANNTEVSEGIAAQARIQATTDGLQDDEIDTLKNKVSALEGTVVEAVYKADARDEPQVGSFVLKSVLNEKVLLFSQASYIVLSTTDFNNKVVDVSKILVGDIVRLSSSLESYANYKVLGIGERSEGKFALEVEFNSAPENAIVFDGYPYNFLHASPFDAANMASITYVDDQDSLNLAAAKSYTDDEIKKIELPEVATGNLMVTTGENVVETGWKIRAPGKDGLYTYMSLATAGELALNHVRNPTESHHAANRGWVTSQHYVSTDEDNPLVEETITWKQNSGSNTPKLLFSDPEEYNPQNHEKRCLYGNYKSGGGTLHHWSFGFNEDSAYWNYDWRFGSNLKMRWVMGDQHTNVMSIDKTGVDMTSAYIVEEVDYMAVPEDKHEELAASARKIDIGHRLTELKRILIELKSSLMVRDSDVREAVLNALVGVEDI